LSNNKYIDFVKIGTLVGFHGLPRDGIYNYKCKLPYAGSRSLFNLKTIYLDLDNSLIAYQIHNNIQALGGKKGQADMMKLALDGGGFKGKDVYVKRAELLVGSKELLVSDYVGCRIKENPGYIVSHFYVQAQDRVTLLARKSKRQDVEFPLEHVDSEKSSVEEKEISVPLLEMWLNMDQIDED